MFVDCDGKEYGAVPKVIKISPYQDLRPITLLEVYPLKFSPRLESKLIQRGKKFVKLAGVAHKKYKGLSIKEETVRQEELESDVIIDFTLAYKNTNKPNVGYGCDPPDFNGDVIEDPTVGDERESVESAGKIPDCGCCPGIGSKSFDDTGFDLNRRTTFLDSTTLLTRRSVDKSVVKNKVKLEKTLLVLLPIRVLGYVLLSRRWYPLDIDLVQDIKERQKEERDGFEDLVLPDGHKNIVRALVKVHAKPPESSPVDEIEGTSPQREMDLVKAKGKGLIILLHGVPGVGKTSTAECVTASTRRPLFPITCGDIGASSAQEVEENLEGYFELARKWGCVLLLDEADVFLSERKRGDITQNSLVSVFLRVLEYYSGILILTTNRVGEFDEAIKSRIHIPLYYPPLDKKSTMQIWDMNLKRLKEGNESVPPTRPIDFSTKDIKAFAKRHWQEAEASATKHHWNGRQIKNAFQTAVALAEWDYTDAVQNKEKEKDSRPLLEARHFDIVATASRKFDKYLTETRGKTDKDSAKTKLLRRDDIDADGELIKSAVSVEYTDRRGASSTVRRHVRERTTNVESGWDSDSSDISDDTDEDIAKMTKQREQERKLKEAQKKKQEDDEKQAKKAERAAKKAQKERKERQEREEREALERKQALASKDSDSNNSDSE